MKNLKKRSVSYMAKVAIFSALSIVLYYIKLPITLIIPIFPEYLDIQFSNLPAIIAGFILGPLGGISVVVIRTVIKLPFTGTLGVGELADLIIGVITVLVGSLVYKKEHTKSGGIIALIFTFITWVVISALANWLIIIPTYMELYHFTAEAFVQMLHFVKGVDESNFMFYYICTIAIPFNTILSLMVCLITYIVYKRVSILVQKLDGKAVDFYEEECIEILDDNQN